MAGHSKWANIKHKKAAQDKKRGKIFTKLIREITVSARLGGPDSAANPRLRAAVQAALSQNMPKDTVERAIKRGAGTDEASNIVEVRYEGYGINGVAVLVDCMTDNKNRTVAEVRHAFTKCGGNLGTDGSVAYLFTKQGIITFDAGIDEDTLMEAAIDAGAEDVESSDEGGFVIITDPNDFGNVSETLTSAGFEPAHSEVMMIPSTEVNLDEEQSEKVMKMIDMLEDLDDVQQVHTNASFSEI